MTKTEIIAAVTKLSAKDRGDVLMAIKALNQMGDVKPIHTREKNEPLLQAIADYLSRRGLIIESPAVEALKRRNSYDMFKKKLPAVQDYLIKLAETSGANSPRIIPQIIHLSVNAVADWLNTRKLFGVGTMLSQIDKIPEALNEAYPAYVSSGLFGFILVNKGNHK